ncbi:MAG: hypothetical protein FWE34_05660 [Defluviitaleaceae bacterium]|nr:hypothetical protein [Defluviitaleaceae bacterium]
MIITKQEKVKKLWLCIGDIDDAFLEEVETADIVAEKVVARKKIIKYSTLAAASVGVATTIYFLLRSRRTAASI